MNLQEFRALAVNDVVRNDMTNGEGTVSKGAGDGPRERGTVSIQWGPSGIEFSYSVHSTAWMHWSVVKPAGEPVTYGNYPRTDVKKPLDSV